jgi:hypothetical protein
MRTHASERETGGWRGLTPSNKVFFLRGPSASGSCAMVGLAGGADQMRQVEGRKCWNLVHVVHLVNSKARTIIVPYCQDKEGLPCLNMGVSYHSKIDACEIKGDC